MHVVIINLIVGVDVYDKRCIKVVSLTPFLWVLMHSIVGLINSALPYDRTKSILEFFKISGYNTLITKLLVLTELNFLLQDFSGANVSFYFLVGEERNNNYEVQVLASPHN